MPWCVPPPQSDTAACACLLSCTGPEADSPAAGGRELVAAHPDAPSEGEELHDQFMVSHDTCYLELITNI